MHQSFDSLRCPSLQTEDELELVNEVICFSPLFSHEHDFFAIDCSIVHNFLAWLRYGAPVPHRFGLCPPRPPP